MLSDEEKKAIVYLKSYCINDVLYDNKHYEQIETVLNLIEKQQKEIERLEARKYMFNAETGEISQIPIDNNYISNEKIKAKIEELERDKNKLYKEQGNIEEIKIYSVIDIIKAEILRFKELLEKE